VTTGPVTTDEILDAAEKRTGLTRPQLLVLVAKSATVRHLATHEKYKDDRELKVTVSVRAGEWLDRDGPPLIYRDPLLAIDSSFPINGLTRNELAAEKLLGWCGKPLPKHLVDLAYLAREHREHINHEQVAKLTRRKFEMEKGARRYRDAGIHSPADLVAAFTKENKLKDLRNDWERFSTTELLFLPGEQTEDVDATLMKVENVERQAIEFWQPTLDLLR
jgi:hypothetical protein